MANSTLAVNTWCVSVGLPAPSVDVGVNEDVNVNDHLERRPFTSPSK